MEKNLNIDYKKVILELASQLVEKKAIDLKLIEFLNSEELFQFVIILTGESFLHQKALSNIVMRLLKTNGLKLHFPLFLNNENPWILMDYNFLAIHIFLEKYRLFYNLEELWQDKETLLLYPK